MIVDKIMDNNVKIKKEKYRCVINDIDSSASITFIEIDNIDLFKIDDVLTFSSLKIKDKYIIREIIKDISQSDDCNKYIKLIVNVENISKKNNKKHKIPENILGFETR